MFEGVPTYPDAGRFWQICDKFGVTVFYTAPTAIRALMRLGDEWVGKYKLDSAHSGHGRRADQPGSVDVVL
jgi:acetyl-CoA synthetase